jgi:hypothetical protein
VRRAARGATQHQRATQQAASRVGERQVERLREAPGPARERPLRGAGRQATQGAHPLQPGHRLERAQQHRRSAAAGFAHHVGAGVHAVAAVDVEAARRTEHRAVAGRRPAVRVRARVAAVADIGLDLDDPADQAGAVGEPVLEIGADQLARHPRPGAVEEGAREGRAEAHGISGGRPGGSAPAHGGSAIGRYHKGPARR